MSHCHNHKDHYRDLCSELKSDLKRKNRELDEADDRLRRTETETKKAKLESQEILKLYHGLQREMQLAYERNAKLQVDKISFEELLDSERKDFDQYKRQQSIGLEESKKLKDALCAMKTEKLDLETKFNTIVMENKELRDRARQYEPRLRELDEIKKRLVQIEQMIADQLQPEIRDQNETAQRAQVRQEQLDRYSKWNTLLRRECEEKTEQLNRYDELIEYSKRLEEEKAILQAEIDRWKNSTSEIDGQMIGTSETSLKFDGSGFCDSTVGTSELCGRTNSTSSNLIGMPETDGQIGESSSEFVDRVSGTFKYNESSSETDGQSPETSKSTTDSNVPIPSQFDHRHVHGTTVPARSELGSVSDMIANQESTNLLIHIGQLRSSLADLERDFRQEVANCTSQLFTVIDHVKTFSNSRINKRSVLASKMLAVSSLDDP